MLRRACRPPGLNVLAGACALLLLMAGSRAGTVTLATYNVENYGPADRMIAAGYRKDYPKPEAEKSALRTVLRALNADVLVLQEMGPRPYLDELQRDLRSEGVVYPHALLGLGVDAARHIAVLSRLPLRPGAEPGELDFPYLGGRETVKRGLLEATVQTGAGELTIFAVHLKSRFTERPDDPGSAIRRAGEATAIRDYILRRFPEPGAARFVVLGDCNDGRTSRPVAFLQKRGKTEITRLLPALDSRGEVWTHAFRREETYSRVDHVFVSPALAPAVEGGAARIYDGPGVREASDHRPVVVTLNFGPSSR